MHVLRPLRRLPEHDADGPRVSLVQQPEPRARQRRLLAQLVRHAQHDHHSDPPPMPGDAGADACACHACTDAGADALTDACADAGAHARTDARTDAVAAGRLRVLRVL